MSATFFRSGRLSRDAPAVVVLDSTRDEGEEFVRRFHGLRPAMRELKGLLLASVSIAEQILGEPLGVLA